MTPRFSVSDFLAVVNQSLEVAFSAVEIEGEVASFKVNQNKWVFFDLMDENGSVGCFMSVYGLRTPIADGMKLIVRALPKVTAWGKFSVTVQSYRPSGEGSLHKGFELLRAKLDKEGLFTPERKRVLPAIPAHIGVISSMQAAGYTDFITILNERWGGMRVDVAHVQVQGEAAADQIIAAIRYFNESEHPPEVLAILRGGGSADDLGVFNDELLVRAIASSRIPTLVGVGHEIDTTLADLAADVRAATPSNAAQIIVPDKREYIAAVHHQVSRIIAQFDSNIDVTRQETRRLLARSLEAAERRIDMSLNQTEQQRRMLAAYDPRAVLARGYAIVRGVARVGSEITIQQSKQTITAEVTHVAANE